jgi:recombination protein RecT
MSQTLSTEKRRDIKEFIQSDVVKNQVALALPHYLTPERMLRICLTSINRNPKLLECTTESLLGSIMQAAQMGLEPDGRQGHLIPYRNNRLGITECQFQADYKGLVGLVRRNSDVEDIYADLVRDKDKFEIKKGLHRDLVHEIDIRADRGDVVGAYAVIKYRGGVTGF